MTNCGICAIIKAADAISGSETYYGYSQCFRQNVLDALRYTDENGIPFHNQGIQDDLVSDNSKKHPPEYVIAVAYRIADKFKGLFSIHP